jgi:hypothetical protein
MLAFTLLMESGCLIPQSIDAIDSDAGPHPAPHFVLGSIRSDLLAPVLTLNRQGPADATASPPCLCQLVLDAPDVEEDDPTVTLQSRWFVDYNLSVPSSQVFFSPRDIPGSFTDLATERQVPLFNFDADSHGIVTNGVHIVELLVGDRDGFDDTSVALPNRAMKPGYEAALYRFTVQVNVTQDPNQPHCATQPYQECR